ncbi:unnamed protein product [Thlaspi arvense]|uniref:Uncharacterized protein n=1 Tax=Thlaspi arvense TaxID=13288 RepID=A0AAU9RF59_THLAR|nr:unnamed protein product [Thlaspi arvense]
MIRISSCFPSGSINYQTKQLFGPQGIELWKPNKVLSVIAYGFMNDTGNFMLLHNDSSPGWESFQSPTDTMLPTQIMNLGGVLHSRQSENRFTPGRFQCRLLSDGNLVLNTRDVQSDFPYEAYYSSGTSDSSNISNSGYQVVFDQTAQMYILRGNNQRMDLATEKLPLSFVKDYYHRTTLNFDGVFGQYYHPKNLSGNPGWKALWVQPDNICLRNTLFGGGSGTCGFNSICRLDVNRRPICECPLHYELLDPNDKHGSCKPRFTQICEEDNSKSVEDLYDFEELIETNWVYGDYETIDPSTEIMCRNSCLYDCFCAAAVFNGNQCWKKGQPLKNGRSDPSANVNGKSFLKFKKADIPPTTFTPTHEINKTKERGTLILVGSLLLEGMLDVLVENDVEALNDREKLERFVMVAFWCIQEDASLRPTMRKVCQMLEGGFEVPVPQNPNQVSFRD